MPLTVRIRSVQCIHHGHDTGTHNEAVTLDKDIFEYENEWVALDGDNRLVEHATRLPELLSKLTPEQEARGLTFMQVFPRGMSFVGLRV